jgi:hypothetical protein
MDFLDTTIINRSRSFADTMASPAIEVLLTDAQKAKVSTLAGLLTDVGNMDFDTEIDILISLMTEIRDR